MNDTVMERLGRYQVREIIGEGAMACVYKAFDPEINRPLAIKLLKAQLRLDGEYRNRFLREAKGAGREPGGGTSCGLTFASSVTSLIRCASPPERVGLCCPSVR